MSWELAIKTREFFRSPKRKKMGQMIVGPGIGIGRRVKTL